MEAIMKRMIKMQIITGLAVALCPLQATAGNVQTGVDAYNETYYGAGAFTRLAGDDGILTEEDWINNRSAIEARYGADFRWDRAMAFDEDGDGALSRSEAKNYRDVEAKRLKSEWRKRGDRLTAEDKKWLRNHPIVAETLAANSRYLETHPRVAKAIYSDRKWLNSHPEVAKKLYGNRRWLDNHPEVAKNLYENRKWLNNHPGVAKAAYHNRQVLNKHPQLRRDLKTHEAQLRKHPRAAKKGYKAAGNHPAKAKKVYAARGSGKFKGGGRLKKLRK